MAEGKNEGIPFLDFNILELRSLDCIGRKDFTLFYFSFRKPDNP